MKNSKKVLLAAAALVAIYTNPALSNPNIEIKTLTSQEEINRLKGNIERDYQDIKSINALGLVYLKLDQFDKAIKQFKKALAVDPSYTLGPIFFGNIYTDAEHYQNKIKEFQKIIKINREYAKAQNYLGLAYLKQNNYSTAKISLLESIKINPKYAKAHNNLGILYEEMGETAKAIESYKLASSINPNDSDSLYNLGLAYDSLGKGENSIRYMVFAKKAHETKYGKREIGRFNDKLDQLWAKYSDKSENISVAALDSNKAGHTDSPEETSIDLSSKTTSTSLFTPADQPPATSNKIATYKTQQPVTVEMGLGVIESDATPAFYNNQNQSVGEWMAHETAETQEPQKTEEKNPISAWPKKNKVTAELDIKENTFTDPKETLATIDSINSVENKTEVAPRLPSGNKKKLAAKKPEKKTWVSDWVFEYSK